MKRAILAGLLVVAAPLAAQAKCDMNGNCYTVTPSYDGGARISGFSASNGTMWNSTVDSNGNQRGFDSSGNSWNYDANSGNYINYGTGKMCFGKGASRFCN